MEIESKTQPAALVVVVLICGGVLPTPLEAQTPPKQWHFLAEAGRYEVHERLAGVGDQPAGVLLAMSAGLYWSALGLHLTVARAIGDDPFTSLEPSIELVVPRGAPVALVGGVGAGFMWESGTLSVPYHAKVGLEGRISEKVHLRATVRRGSHANTGDAGTFRGPHAITLGIAWTR